MDYWLGAQRQGRFLPLPITSSACGGASLDSPASQDLARLRTGGDFDREPARPKSGSIQPSRVAMSRRDGGDSVLATQATCWGAERPSSQFKR